MIGGSMDDAFLQLYLRFSCSLASYPPFEINLIIEITIGTAATRKAPNALTFCANDSLIKNCSVSGTLYDVDRYIARFNLSLPRLSQTDFIISSFFLASA